LHGSFVEKAKNSFTKRWGEREMKERRKNQVASGVNLRQGIDLKYMRNQLI